MKFFIIVNGVTRALATCPQRCLLKTSANDRGLFEKRVSTIARAPQGASRKRAFLGQIGVCTIDQVLLSVLPVRHQFVRAFGLRKSVLIVDEVHAYDAYMYGLLGRVLNGQQRAGGSALLLSATLPLQQKEILISAWGGELQADCPPEQTPYPLITWASSEGHCTFWELEQDQRPPNRIVNIECYESPDLLPDTELCQRIVSAAEQGALVGIVCNLVADAQALALRLREISRVPVDLFHARYRFADRQVHELNAVRCYGDSTERCFSRILVATQVIEQSLDLDFDWLISQLCPVDLLFQRLGRLHRHERGNRHSDLANPRCTVLLPKAMDYGLHAKVYKCERVLQRTQQLLRQTDEVVFPEAYRAWIEQVYQNEPWPGEPTVVTEQYEHFVQEELGRYFSARQFSKSDAFPWPDTEGAAARLTRDGDTNLSVLLLQDTSAGLALLSGEQLEALLEDERDELLNLNTVGVPSGWVKWLGEPEENIYRLIFKPVGENGWVCEQKDQKFHYSSELGLCRLL